MTSVRRRVRSGVRKYAGILVPYLLVMSVAAGGLWGIRNAQTTACHRQNANRAVLRQVVDVATAPASAAGGPVDLTKIPGFDALDVHTQAYLTNLSNLLSRANQPGQPPLHDRLIAAIPDVEC